MQFCLDRWLLLTLVVMLSGSLRSQIDTTKAATPEQEAYVKAVQLIDSAKYKDAETELKKALKIKKDYWEVMNKMALIKIKNEKYKDAEKDLEAADKIAPNNYETLKFKGLVYFNTERMKECKVSFDSAFSIMTDEKKEDAELCFYCAKLMMKGKSYKTALDMAALATEYKPKFVDAMVLKGEIRFLQKDYNYAIKELNEAIKNMSAEKPNYEAYKLRAKSKFEVKDFKGAVTDWNVYIEANPGEEETLISRAAAKINSNDNTSAIVDLDEAIKLNKKNAVSYCYRGVAKGGNKNYTEALKDLDYAIKLKFDYSAAYVNRAAIKFASKDKRGACEDLQKADGLADEMAYKLIEQYCK
jgi:tetratricopeptide (TPR) repeat protein